jgi:hypothetical protein
MSPSHLVLIAENMNLRCGSATKGWSVKCSVFCVPYSVFIVLYSVFSVLCSTFRVPGSTFRVPGHRSLCCS